jgi:hypothetical protein
MSQAHTALAICLLLLMAGDDSAGILADANWSERQGTPID